MSTANTLFVMIASILVFLMTPGLAFFYGGLVSQPQHRQHVYVGLFRLWSIRSALGSSWLVTFIQR
jgi:ammonia channel protein AmtB